MPGSDAPEIPPRVKVLRVIARLNMGGPALHVAYLTEGLGKRGYETTLVAGSLARGEDSMAFVADAQRHRLRARPGRSCVIFVGQLNGDLPKTDGDGEMAGEERVPLCDRME